MFKTDEVQKVAARAMDIINVLDGLTVDEAQLVLKQAETVIMGVQRVAVLGIHPDDALTAIKRNLGL